MRRKKRKRAGVEYRAWNMKWWKCANNHGEKVTVHIIAIRKENLYFFFFFQNSYYKLKISLWLTSIERFTGARAHMTVCFILQYCNFQNLSEETDKIIHNIRFCIFFFCEILKFIIKIYYWKRASYDKWKNELFFTIKSKIRLKKRRIF